MYSTFEEMFTYYMRRRIFDRHDKALITQEIVHDNDSFLAKIVKPKMHLGRLNYGDYIRICSVIL